MVFFWCYIHISQREFCRGPTPDSNRVFKTWLNWTQLLNLRPEACEANATLRPYYKQKQALSNETEPQLNTLFAPVKFGSGSNYSFVFIFSYLPHTMTEVTEISDPMNRIWLFLFGDVGNFMGSASASLQADAELLSQLIGHH